MANESDKNAPLDRDGFKPYEEALMKALDDFNSNIWRLPTKEERNGARRRVESHATNGPLSHLNPHKSNGGLVTGDEDECYQCCLAKYQTANGPGFQLCVSDCRAGSILCPPGA